MADTVLHRKSFRWNIEKFNTSNKTTKKSFKLASRHFNINLEIRLYIQNEYSSIQITKSKGKDINYAICKIYPMDADGKELDEAKFYEYQHSNLEDNLRLPMIVKREHMSNRKLVLQLEFTIGVDEISHGESQPFSDTPSPTNAVLLDNNKPDMSSKTSSSPLQKDLLGLYRDQKLCDVTLKTDDASFLVHKTILGARSPVFCTMFENEKEERRKSVIDIPDVDQDTLNRMIQFLYTDSLEDMHWVEASKLYYAADKYAVDSLKGKCRAPLKAELTVSNACEIIALAYTHRDEELVQFVQEFICEHNDIILSEEWRCLHENNPLLTDRLLEAIVMNLMKEKQ